MLHKAIIRYDWKGHFEQSGPVWLGQAARPIPIHPSKALTEAALIWLKANGREEHLVNYYDNFGELVLVLSDRDTAILLKLAIQP